MSLDSWLAVTNWVLLKPPLGVLPPAAPLGFLFESLWAFMFIKGYWGWDGGDGEGEPFSFLSSDQMISCSFTELPPVEPVRLFFSLSCRGLGLRSVRFLSSPMVISFWGWGGLRTFGGRELLWRLNWESGRKVFELAVPVSALRCFMLSLRS